VKPLFRAQFDDGVEGDVLLILVQLDDGTLVCRTFDWSDRAVARRPVRRSRKRQRR
jgi:hypothetical protein